MRTSWATAEEVGNRLRLARKSRDLDLEMMSHELKISTAIIEDIENGIIQNNYQEIFAIACRLSKPIHEIFNGFFDYNRIQIFFLRDKSEEVDTEEVKEYVLDYIRFQQELYGCFTPLSVVASIQDVRPPIKEVLPAILESRSKDLCRRVDIFKLPVNVYQIAANLGFIVTFETLPKSLYGLRGFSYKEGDFHLIVVNKIHSVELQRFTVAHEIHHLLYDSNSALFSCGSFNEEEALERNAENFSAELLMPRSSIERLISYPRNVQYLTINLMAKHFNVSYQAAAIRLQKFGLIDSAAEACQPNYKKKDKEKSRFLLEKKTRHLEAVFGLETGIPELQMNQDLPKHDTCGAYIFDESHTKCWNCGLAVRDTNPENVYLNNPYLQSSSNLRPNKVSAVTQKEDFQLSLNFRISS